MKITYRYAYMSLIVLLVGCAREPHVETNGYDIFKENSYFDADCDSIGENLRYSFGLSCYSGTPVIDIVVSNCTDKKFSFMPSVIMGKISYYLYSDEYRVDKKFDERFFMQLSGIPDFEIDEFLLISDNFEVVTVHAKKAVATSNFIPVISYENISSSLIKMRWSVMAHINDYSIGNFSVARSDGYEVLRPCNGEINFGDEEFWSE